MQADEVLISWVAGGHTFKLAVSLNSGTLTVQLSMPSEFLAGADDTQRRAYGEARDRALHEVADVLAMQHECERPIHQH